MPRFITPNVNHLQASFPHHIHAVSLADAKTGTVETLTHTRKYFVGDKDGNLKIWERAT